MAREGRSVDRHPQLGFVWGDMGIQGWEGWEGEGERCAAASLWGFQIDDPQVEFYRTPMDGLFLLALAGFSAANPDPRPILRPDLVGFSRRMLSSALRTQARHQSTAASTSSLSYAFAKTKPRKPSKPVSPPPTQPFSLDDPSLPSSSALTDPQQAHLGPPSALSAALAKEAQPSPWTAHTHTHAALSPPLPSCSSSTSPNPPNPKASQESPSLYPTKLSDHIVQFLLSYPLAHPRRSRSANLEFYLARVGGPSYKGHDFTRRKGARGKEVNKESPGGWGVEECLRVVEQEPGRAFADPYVSSSFLLPYSSTLGLVAFLER